MVDARTKDVLGQMLDVLERENEALRSGGEEEIIALSVEKQGVAEQMSTLEAGQIKMASELRLLGKQVKDLADLNATLITQMNQHYTGMLSMMMSLSGKSQTYAPNGYMSAPVNSVSRRKEIIA